MKSIVAHYIINTRVEAFRKKIKKKGFVMCDLISVIVPVYNVEKYLDKCINSIINQTYQNLEIILVDDGSTDNSGILCDAFCNKDGRVQVIHQKNGGLSSARNTGIDHSNGNYLTFVDSDDWIDPTMIERLYSRIKEDHSQISFCDFKYVDEQGNISYDGHGKVNKVLDEYQFWQDVYTTKNTVCYIVSWGKLIQRSVFENGIRFEEGKIHEDEFIIHRLLQNRKISFLSEHLYMYYQRNDSITRNASSKRHFNCAEALLIRTSYFIEKNKPEFAQECLLSSMFPILDGITLLPYDKIHLRELKMCFRQLYMRLFFSNTTMYFRCCGLMFAISPNLYRFILCAKNRAGIDIKQ